MTKQFTISVLAICLFLGMGLLLTNSIISQDSIAAEHETEEHTQVGFIHNVYFWVNEGTTDAQIQQLIDDCKEYLGAIESVEKVVVGKPAGTDREVVDNSYAVNLIVYFKNKAAHDHYQDAEKHHEFIERNQSIWKKVQVYDMIPE